MEYYFSLVTERLQQSKGFKIKNIKKKEEEENIRKL